MKQINRREIEGLDALEGFDLIDYGVVPNSGNDDTANVQAAIDAAAAAGGGRIYSSTPGVVTISGPLRDTAGANAQILLPSVSAVGSEQITIVIEGPTPPPPVFSVVGTTPPPDNHLVFSSTLTAGAGGQVIGARGPAGSFESFTFLNAVIRNVTIRVPSNPVLTGLDLRYVTAVELDNVVVDCGYYVQGYTEPTTSTSYGIRLPKNNNGAHTRLGTVNVGGFYTGYEFSEHAIGREVNAWGCKRAVEFTFGYHASFIERLMAVHCQRGIVVTAAAYFEVDQFDVEHAASGWWAPVYDLDDASNYGHGALAWHVVLAGTGVDSTFTVNGATGIQTRHIGTPPTTSSPLTVQDENSNISTAVTQIDFQGAGVTTTAGAGEVIVTIPGGGSGAPLQPLTTLDIDGVPSLVWDENDELVMIEVTL